MFSLTSLAKIGEFVLSKIQWMLGLVGVIFFLNLVRSLIRNRAVKKSEQKAIDVEDSLAKDVVEAEKRWIEDSEKNKITRDSS